MTDDQIATFMASELARTKAGPLPTLKRGHLKGTVQAYVGLRVSVPVPGDRHDYACFERYSLGTITDIRPQAGFHTYVVAVDEPTPFSGDTIEIRSIDDRIIAMDR